MKIILAIGHSEVEKSIEKQLPDHCEVVGIATYREAVLNKLRENPTTDVLLIRDNLQGNVKILTLIHQIRAEFSKCRIVLMTKNREAGDPFLSAVVSYAVWDIILGYKVSIAHMIDYILNPRSFKDVERFQKRVMVDESTPTSEVESTTPTTPAPIPPNASTLVESSKKEALNEAETETPFPSSSEGNESLVQKVSMEETTHTFHPTSAPKGSMREQLHHQLEKGTEPAVSPIVSIDKEAGFSLDSSDLSDPPFVFSSSTDTGFSTVEPMPDIPIPTVESFVLDPSEEVTQKEPQPSIPKFEYGPAKSEPIKEERSKEPKKPKLFSTKDVDSIDKPLVGHRPAFNSKIKNSPIVMSLVGFKSGVGTSQTAFNLAVQLARHKNKVLYVELNDHSLPLMYLYNLSSLKGGMEDALRAVGSDSMQDFSAYVTRFSDLKQRHREKDMQLLLKTYPDTLDFITFSHFFIQQEKEKYYPEHLKELLSNLLLSEGYQYIVLDVNVHSNPVLVSQALRSSKYICPIITQDMLSIGQSVESLKAIHQNQFLLTNKVQFILNRYDNTCHNDRSILKWINHELPFKALGIWTIPEASAAYNKANDKSKPVVLNSPPKSVIQAFETLHNYLKTM